MIFLNFLLVFCGHDDLNINGENVSDIVYKSNKISPIRSLSCISIHSHTCLLVIHSSDVLKYGAQKCPSERTAQPSYETPRGQCAKNMQPVLDSTTWAEDNIPIPLKP